MLRAEWSPRSGLYRSRRYILRGPYLVALLRIVSSISRNGAECVWKCELKKLIGETWKDSSLVDKGEENAERVVV